MNMRQVELATKVKTWILAAAVSLAVPVVAKADHLADALIGAYETSDLLAQNLACCR